ncbi:MAG TPA: serine kinase [Negativicutes bacterium]|jgi:predicted transcriptional regulator
MTVQEIMDALDLTVVAGNAKIDNVVSSGYASDLLSNVMGQAAMGSIWVTMQGHQNIVAVSSLLGLAAVIVAGGVQPDKEAIGKAETEGIVLLTTALPVFQVVGILYSMGVRGMG